MTEQGDYIVLLERLKSFSVLRLEKFAAITHFPCESLVRKKVEQVFILNSISCDLLFEIVLK